jgi:hypothetical protein
MTGGKKFDDGKLRWDLLPLDAVEGVVEVLTKGAAKYGDRNWEEGLLFNRCYAAAMRHIKAWWQDGVELDEIGTHPLDNAICELMFIRAFIARGRKDLDDRPGGTQEV